ncbi:hypothetical protein GCM10009087_40510 [Sphingomonas oligophenolica]|uniref:Uncharacterized protein n=1 Tax=Sphingomonas oligophenolica TaxID=301154 RepID=A0ABU9Y217_9SPHN
MDISPAEATVMAALIGGLVALVTGLVTASLTRSSTERRLRREFVLDYAAERVAHELLQSEWPLRSLNVIKIHLGGFSDNDLRKILVRAGAIRFVSKSGAELWGLLERNRQLLGVTHINEDPANPPIMPEWMAM